MASLLVILFFNVLLVVKFLRTVFLRNTSGGCFWGWKLASLLKVNSVIIRKQICIFQGFLPKGRTVWLFCGIAFFSRLPIFEENFRSSLRSYFWISFSFFRSRLLPQPLKLIMVSAFKIAYKLCISYNAEAQLHSKSNICNFKCIWLVTSSTFYYK